MLKRIILLKRKDGLSRADMLHYWQYVHAPLAMQYPAWFESTQRYAQNHVLEQVDGEPFDFDGMVESWQRPPGSANSGLQSFPDTPAYKDVVGPDELNFMDRAASLLLFGEEQLMMARSGAVKLLTFLARRDDAGGEDLALPWRESHAESRRRFPGFWQGVRGCAHNVTVPGSLRVIGVPGVPAPHAIDGIAELRFDSREALSAALASEGQAALQADRRAFAEPALASLVVREVILYERSPVNRS